MQRRLHSVMLVASLMTVAVPAPGAQAQSSSALQAQISKLTAGQRKSDSTIARLEARLARLEAASERDDTDMREEAEKAEDAIEFAALERRVSALERSPSAKGGTASGAVSRTVRAPFVVEDDDGGVILRVTGGKSPRLMIGDEKGGQVELGTGSAGGGIVRVRDASHTDRAMIIASDGFGQFRATGQNHSAILTASSVEDGATLGLFKGDTPSARLRSGMLGFGGLILTSPSGDPTVFAGAQEGKGCSVGVVKAGPRGRPGTMGPPSTLQGVC